jgi:hypothetical protein
MAAQLAASQQGLSSVRKLTIRHDIPEDYKNYLRMSDENLKYVLAKVKPLIVKQCTVMRNGVTPEARVSQRLFVSSLQDSRLKISSL